MNYDGYALGVDPLAHEVRVFQSLPALVRIGDQPATTPKFLAHHDHEVSVAAQTLAAGYAEDDRTPSFELEAQILRRSRKDEGHHAKPLGFIPQLGCAGPALTGRCRQIQPRALDDPPTFQDHLQRGWPTAFAIVLGT